ncbi:MAG: metal-dependent hydrolase [Alphaproteobacteria bacterium]|nr:metal-dependent hydrolase [Alphaproteobacteria bacterium]
MADLVTHIATALLWKAGSRRPNTGVLVVGVALPDLAGRAPTMLAARVSGAGGPELPDAIVYGAGVLHMPLGFVAMCLVLSALVVPRDREAVFVGLLGGCALHLALDLLQHHVGVGYPLLFPLSAWHFELGWIGSEDTVPWALPALGLAALAWLARHPDAQRLRGWRPSRSRGDPHGPGRDRDGE